MKLYQMYNGFNNNLLSDDLIIEAKSGAEAVKKLLNMIGIKFTKIKRSASNNVMVKAEPFKYGKNGVMYRDGVVSWFEVWNNDTCYR
jgi:hypothetical protein